MAINPTISTRAIVHPGVHYQQALENASPTDFWGRANSYRCPLGAEPGRCWLLLLRSDIENLSKTAYHELIWKSGSAELKIKNLVLADTNCMDLALAGNLKEVHLCEFQDVRATLQKSSINSQYNVRFPAPSATSGDSLFYTDSTNGGTAWTWQTLLDDIWGNLPAVAGTAPTLPHTPDGTPEGFRFIGVSAWAALHEVLRKIHCTTALDPTTVADAKFSYVQLGTVDPDLAETLEDLAGRLMYDYDPVPDLNLAEYPATIRVFFMRREEYHGIEKDTIDSGNWEMAPVVSKDYTTGITGAAAGTVLPVWDDLSALTDSAGTVSNDTALQTRADEIGEDLVDKIESLRDGLHRLYQGIVLTVLPGSEITSVTWRDYGDDWGLVTEIERRPMPGGLSRYVSEHLQTPDLSRNTHPNYPQTDQIIRADDGSSTTGDALTANASGLYPGFVLRWIGSYQALEACWIRPLDLEPGMSPSESTVVSVRQDDRLLGRLYGNQTVSSDTRPVYLARIGGSGTTESIACGTVLFEVGDSCDGVTGDTPAGLILDITDVIYTFPTQVEPNGKITLVQESGDSCEWRSASSGYLLTVFGGASTRNYYWKLKRVAGSPDTWTLTMHDDTDDTTVITLDGADASPVMSGSEALMTTLYAWTGVDVTLTASKIDANYDFEDTGAGFCLNPT